MSSKNFSYKAAPYRFVMKFTDGRWDDGYLSEDPNIVLNESACVFQYSQSCFEGLKAYRTKEGRIVCFRPDLNAERMADSCKRMVMPIVPKEKFFEALDQVILANEEMIPEYGSNGSLYIRPFMIGTSSVLGVSPATEFEFRMIVSPVGSYFDERAKSISLRISDYDRAAPKGTGHIKAGINYAMSLYPLQIAHEEGYDENLYLDSREHLYIEETGGANIFFISHDNKLLFPESSSILPSITRRSVKYLAEEYLGLRTEERQMSINEIDKFKECGLCGTAAVIAPVGNIDVNGRRIIFDTSADGYGEICKKIRDCIQKIQYCELDGPEGWIHMVR
ncbi:MAG: branched-chain amino acid aminotransferase [Erysipelotrichaceae bacterium]|nr:branched-chain amino acid aminotransferase [Erysipelotrichaceae bacterium]